MGRIFDLWLTRVFKKYVLITFYYVEILFPLTGVICDL